MFDRKSALASVAHRSLKMKLTDAEKELLARTAFNSAVGKIKSACNYSFSTRSALREKLRSAIADLDRSFEIGQADK